MSFLIVVAGFPLLLAALAIGNGLLVERATGMRLPLTLVPAVGFAALVVVGQFTTWISPLARATPWVLVALAVLGFVLGWRAGLAERWRARSRGWWLAPLAGLGVYVMATAPVLTAARLTFPAYLLDTTGSIQLMGAEWLLHHGRKFPTGNSTFDILLNGFFGADYPSGGQVLLGSTGSLTGQELTWLYEPFQACELAISALVLAFLAGRAGLSRLPASITGFIAAVPALVYAYVLMGSIKELTALPMLLTMGAFIVLARRTARLGIRGALPFALAGAAALGAIGLSATPWVFLFGVAAFLFAAPSFDRERLRSTAVRGAASLVVLTLLLALPTIGPLSTTLKLASHIDSENPAAVNDPGNLLRPLRFVQMLGVWLGESHRVEARYALQTYLLIGIVIVCIVLGVAALVRRRSWALLSFGALSFGVWALLTETRGTEWTDAKLLMLTSPVVMLAALIGAFRLGGARRAVEGWLLAGIVIFGVLASDALLYHATALAPTQRFQELRAIGQRFSGQGPTLLPDFDEYAIYLLASENPSGPGQSHGPPMQLVGDAPTSYGISYDIDQISQSTVQQFRLIVLRQSPSSSRPPGNYREVWNGPSYTVWKRDGPAPALHVPLGGGQQPVAVPKCAEIRKLARDATKRREHLRVAERAPNVIADIGSAAHSPNVVFTSTPQAEPQLTFAGPAEVSLTFRVKSSGRYELWLGGQVDRPLHVVLDGHLIATPAENFGDNGNKFAVAQVSLSAGTHTLTLTRGASNLLAGENAGTVINAAIFEPLSAKHETMRELPPSQARSLCGRWLDWIELT